MNKIRSASVMALAMIASLFAQATYADGIIGSGAQTLTLTEQNADTKYANFPTINFTDNQVLENLKVTISRDPDHHGKRLSDGLKKSPGKEVSIVRVFITFQASGNHGAGIYDQGIDGAVRLNISVGQAAVASTSPVNWGVGCHSVTPYSATTELYDVDFDSVTSVTLLPMTKEDYAC